MLTLLEFCQEPPEPGSCTELSNKWFFHYKEQCCKLFTFTCGNKKAENINRFDSRHQCMKVCAGITDPLFFNCDKNATPETNETTNA